MFTNIKNKLFSNITQESGVSPIENKHIKFGIEMQQLLKDRALLKKRLSEEIVFTNSIIEKDGVGLIFENTINTIQGKTGTHKSRLAEIICRLLLSINKINLLGLQRSNLKSSDYTVLFVDTERNLKDQFPYALQHIISKSGYSMKDHPPNFDWISLINISRKKRFSALKDYLELHRAKIDNHLVVVLDVITDCISSFNDVNDSLSLIDMLNVMVNEHDVTFICVIHENPGGEKARGHLGTEIINKATAQIQVSLSGLGDGDELITVKFLKARKSKRQPEIYAKYSEEEKGLVLADTGAIQAMEQGRKKKATIDEVMNYLPEILIAPTEREKLIELLMDHFSCSKNTILERLKLIVNENRLIAFSNGYYKLIKSKEGKQVFYDLQVTE